MCTYRFADFEMERDFLRYVFGVDTTPVVEADGPAPAPEEAEARIAEPRLELVGAR